MFQIFYHKLVFKQDFKKIPFSNQSRIFKTIHKKLTADPKAFGKALLGDLKGYYRLRVDPYRVVYRVDGNRITVFVLHIGMRRDFEVYIEAAHRLKLL
jgi:mRNA interferase RelE/StbE